MIKKSLVLNFPKILLILILVIVLIHLANILMFSKNIDYKVINFESKKVSNELIGYKVVFIIDTHQIPGSELTKVVDNLNEKGGVDLVLLGGDFPNRDAAYRTMEILSKIENKDGIYGVEGNHDFRTELIDAMSRYGIQPLLNQGKRINESLFLAGVEDLWVGQPQVDTATANSQAEDFVLLLSHNPDIMMQQDMSLVDLTLSGHTHGGHVTFFGFWAPALANTKNITDYGQRFMRGLCYNDSGDPVYVSSGSGYYNGIPRVFSRPEVTTIILQNDSQLS